MSIEITPIPFEPYRYVVGATDPEDAYIVDLQYVDDGHRKPAPFCGCPDFMGNGNRACKHLRAVAAWELERICAI